MAVDWWVVLPHIQHINRETGVGTWSDLERQRLAVICVNDELCEQSTSLRTFVWFIFWSLWEWASTRHLYNEISWSACLPYAHSHGHPQHGEDGCFKAAILKAIHVWMPELFSGQAVQYLQGCFQIMTAAWLCNNDARIDNGVALPVKYCTPTSLVWVLREILYSHIPYERIWCTHLQQP